MRVVGVDVMRVRFGGVRVLHADVIEHQVGDAALPSTLVVMRPQRLERSAECGALGMLRHADRQREDVRDQLP